MKNNCYVTETDSFRLLLYNKKEVIEMFGEEYLEEYGHFVPENLIKEYIETWDKFKQICKQIEKNFPKD